MRTWPCPDGCGAQLTRQQKKNHARLWCPKRGAPGATPRKCDWRECEVVITPSPTQPLQRFCSKRCWTKREHEKRAERWRREKAAGNPREEVLTAEEREELHMAPQRLRAAEVSLEARRAGAAVETAREKSYALWFSLVGRSARST